MAQARRSRRTTIDPNGPVLVYREGQESVRAEARRAVQPIKVAWIPIADIDETPPDLNSRQIYDDGSINELAGSIKEHGILQPVRVRPNGERYTLVFGMRRLKAAIRAGMQEIPATIEVSDDDNAFLLNTIENMHRHQLSGSERVRAIERLAATNIGVRELSRRTGFHASTLSKWIRIDRHPAIRAALERESINLGQAMELASAPPQAVPGLLRQVWNVASREDLRKLVQEASTPEAFRSETVDVTPKDEKPVQDPVKERSQRVVQYCRALTEAIDEGSIVDLTAGAKREIMSLFRKLNLLAGK